MNELSLGEAIEGPAKTAGLGLAMERLSTAEGLQDLSYKVMNVGTAAEVAMTYLEQEACSLKARLT